ncbi:MAG: DUF433 domain-containing protein [Planctomycetes bacterium]|nr:DUF433 domain-containing protein [Planctomycetota bacterium]
MKYLQNYPFVDYSWCKKNRPKDFSKRDKKGLIVCDPKILNGKPIVGDTRIFVALIL